MNGKLTDVRPRRQPGTGAMLVAAAILLAVSSPHSPGGGNGSEELAAEETSRAERAVSVSAAKSMEESASSGSDIERIEAEWGIQIEGIRRTAGGYMLDFRYRVVDAGKAAPLFDRKTKPYLLDQATGARFLVPSPPKTGPLRTSNPPLEGRIYWMFFANPGRYVKPGDRVTVIIGDFRAENLTVE